MDIFDYLEEMQVELFQKSFEEIEAKYYQLCSTIAGDNVAERIRNINLDILQTKLKSSLPKALYIANEQSVEAIYFEYDMDNEWESTFFVCDEYSSLSEEDDDWDSEWIAEIEGPINREFAQIYQENGFDETEKAKAKAVTLFLVIRTVTALGTVAQSMKVNVPPLCIGFHDQDPIMRIKE
ncbi:hypothetical protein V7079_25035 [Priestia megaterium]|uniref:hypothetical protein n=1 Tax=Priestia megaterium TaxID=1404 RepID=UPI000BF46750|nr:hypothetical protein [Priestia megaterium]PFJ95373.1 hypothetical protein COI96_27235 [Priestia megaterium]PMD11873.1 hypothetical protein CJ194_00080 [Priestia megaterium]TJZ37341.1 hypothetical protein FA002_16055 [Priestia megaterium]